MQEINRRWPRSAHTQKLSLATASTGVYILRTDLHCLASEQITRATASQTRVRAQHFFKQILRHILNPNLSQRPLHA